MILLNRESSGTRKDAWAKPFVRHVGSRRLDRVREFSGPVKPGSLADEIQSAQQAGAHSENCSGHPRLDQNERAETGDGAVDRGRGGRVATENGRAHVLTTA